MQTISKESEKFRKEGDYYYQYKTKMMKYKTYLDKGYLLGSGSKVAAHRNVVQQ